MSDEKPHIKIQFRDRRDYDHTHYYAADGTTFKRFQAWLKQQGSPAWRERDTPETDPAGIKMMNWLCNNGAELDRADGPAVIVLASDGTRFEHWYHNGKQHRENGPAMIRVGADGSRREGWYRDGKQHRIGGPAYISITAHGTRFQYWYRAGELIQKVTPFDPARPRGLRLTPRLDCT